MPRTIIRGSPHMAKFTLFKDVTEVTSATMHAGKEKGTEGRKLLQLVGVPYKERESLTIVSDDDATVKPSAPILYDGAMGIWTVKLIAKTTGSAVIQAKVKEKVEAEVAVTVVDKLVMPAVNFEAGMLV